MFTTNNQTRKNRFSQFTVLAALVITTSTLTLAGVRNGAEAGQKVRGGGNAFGHTNDNTVKIPRGGAMPGSGDTTVSTDGMRVKLSIDEPTLWIVTIAPPNGGAQASDPTTSVSGLSKRNESNGRRRANEYLVSLPRGGAMPGSGDTTVTLDGMRVQPRADDEASWIVTIDPPNGGAETSDPTTTVSGLSKRGENGSRRRAGEYLVSLPRGGAMPGSGDTTITTSAMTSGAGSASRFDLSAGGMRRIDPAYIRNTPFAGSDAASMSGASLALTGEGGRSIQAAVSFTLR